MIDPRMQKLADVLVKYSTRVSPGDFVCIGSDPLALPLVECVSEAVLAAGGHPVWAAQSESLRDIHLEKADQAQLEWVSPLDLYRTQNADVYIALWAEVNTKSAGATDPARSAVVQAARKPVMDVFMKRTSDGSMRWCGTQVPTQAAAQDAEMSLRQYERFVYGAGLLDLPDPIAAWREIHEKQERIREMLQTKKELRFRVPPHNGNDGTDLTVGVDGGIWINCAGTENFPDGEVFAGPQDVNGHVNYTFPAVYQGREVEGVRLRFKDGRVVDASATRNEAFLISMLDLDQGARNLGEIAIGTNYAIKQFSKNTLFDEKIGGTFHAAVGAGYPESGSNNESGLHWDMVCDLRVDASAGLPGGVVEADGEVIHRDGAFTDASLALSV